MVLNFSSIADYRAAKESGGEILAAMGGGLSTSVISLINASADTPLIAVDAKNVFIPREKGQMGDWLVYNTNTAEYCWLKSYWDVWNCDPSKTTVDYVNGTPYDSNNPFPVGQMYCNKIELNNAGYSAIGQCVERVGNTCLIASMKDPSRSNDWIRPWAVDTTTLISGVNTSESVYAGIKSGGSAACGTCVPEFSYGTTGAAYGWPIPRASWDACCKAIALGNAASGTFSTGSWSVTSGSVASITFTHAVAGSKTINPADWGYDFDRWYDDQMVAIRPAPSGILADPYCGRRNTGVLRKLSSSTVDNSAARLAANQTVSDVPEYSTVGSFWLPSAGELYCACRNAIFLNSRGGRWFIQDAYWTSDQSSDEEAWYISFQDGLISTDTKDNQYRVRPFTTFEI